MKLNKEYLERILKAILEDNSSAEKIADLTGLDRSLINCYMEFLDVNGYIKGAKGWPIAGVGEQEYLSSVLTHAGRVAVEDLDGVFREESRPVRYDLRGAKFGGGFAAADGIQIGGMLNDYSIDAQPNEIDTLMNSLLGLSQDFPQEQLETVQEILEDLREVLQQPEKQTSNRMKRFIGTLLSVAVAVGGTVAGGADFANNTLELSEKLSIPATTFESQLQQLKQVNPDFDWQP
jgi:hypothetical protein